MHPPRINNYHKLLFIHLRRAGIEDATSFPGSLILLPPVESVEEALGTRLLKMQRRNRLCLAGARSSVSSLQRSRKEAKGCSNELQEHVTSIH